MILMELVVRLIVAAVVLLLLAFLLVMAGVGAVGAGLAAVLGAVIFWLVFPGTYGVAVLLLVLVVGLLLVDRRSRHRREADTSSINAPRLDRCSA
jgi:membrane protein implicated in regulation of membrane protease activity